MGAAEDLGDASKFAEPTARQARFAMAGITLLAAGLRLFRIDAQSAWIDEAFTIHARRDGGMT
jgi:hypothetical protein